MDSVTIFGVKYTHIVVIESALYLYEKLVDEGHANGPGDVEWRLRPGLWTGDGEQFFSEQQNWLRFAGGLIIAFGSEGRHIAHRIRAVGQ